MALLENSGNLGSPMPSFRLQDVYEKQYDSTELKDRITLITFICGHCPYVQAIEERLIQLGQYCKEHNVEMLGICSNDFLDYPEDSPEELKKRYEEKSYSFPYLIDPEQTVAQSFGAICTPDIFLYNEKGELAYHGRLDDNWKDASNVKKHELKDAIDALLKNEKPSQEQIPTMGCSIKWKET